MISTYLLRAFLFPGFRVWLLCVDALEIKSSRSPVSEGPGVKLGFTGLSAVMGLDPLGWTEIDRGGPLAGGVVAEIDSGNAD